MIKEIAEYFKNHPSIKVIPFFEPLILEGDHAGISETSLMLYLENELVRMDRIGTKNYDDHGWQEHNSPEIASAEKGRRDIERIITYLKEEIEKVLNRE